MKKDFHEEYGACHALLLVKAFQFLIMLLDVARLCLAQACSMLQVNFARHLLRFLQKRSFFQPILLLYQHATLQTISNRQKTILLYLQCHEIVPQFFPASALPGVQFKGICPTDACQAYETNFSKHARIHDKKWLLVRSGTKARPKINAGSF